jgi:hypothetical protein
MTLRTVTYDTATHKIVPLEPTTDMRRALFINLVHADDESNVIKAVLAAAPEYQEPIKDE